VETHADSTKAVDIPGCIYQLSYAPEPNFPRVFPSRAEMRDYLVGVANRFGVQKHVELNMSWKQSTWHEDRKVWTTELQNTKTGELFIQECKVLVGAIGHQVDPKDFEPKGKQLFKGVITPACKYPTGLDLQDKNVVVLGNGSTCGQTNNESRC
jgi:cation diffusion facilitator CzcD-associated flavoprotein CzcO